MTSVVRERTRRARRASLALASLVLACLPLASLALAGCASAPSPRGVSTESEHYEVRSDSWDPELVRRAARAAEREAALLAADFGGAARPSFPIILCTDPARFARYRDDSGAHGPAIGFFSRSPRFAVVLTVRHWERVLAHELVHAFVEATVPTAPFWVDEGLARELSHGPDLDRRSLEDGDDPLEPRAPVAPVEEVAPIVIKGRDVLPATAPPSRPGGPRGPGFLQRCAVTRLAACKDERIRELLASLPSWDEADPRDAALRSDVAAAAVRFGLETQGWPDVRAAATFRPDPDAFLAWLRGSPTHARFPPVGGE